MKKHFFLISIFLFVVFASLKAQEQQVAVRPNGTGSISDPFLISSLENLYWLSQNTSSVVYKFLKQTQNIDATDTKRWSNNGSYRGFTPIGTPNHAFFGKYDGNGHTISNLYINRGTEDHVGLFGWCTNASIKNLKLTNTQIIGKGAVGALVGTAYSSTIENCCISNSLSTSGTGIGIHAKGGVGGLVGFCRSTTIKNSYSKSKIWADTGAAGGLVASGSENSKITNCYFAGIIISSGTTGGLAAQIISGATGENSFWDLMHPTSAFGTGKTSEEMKKPCMYIDAGWDFIAETNNGTNNIWGMSTGYPFLYYERTHSNNCLPTIQANSVALVKTGSTSAKVSWKRGNGEKCVVFMKLATSASPTVNNQKTYLPISRLSKTSTSIKRPVSTKTTTANFGEGSLAGTGWYCVYNGRGTNVSVNKLALGKTYRVMVIEYNGATKHEHYLTKTIRSNPVNKLLK